MDLMKALTSQYMKQELPEVQVGDTVRVHVKIKEGSRERIQIFEGTVIAKKHGGIEETITVRRSMRPTLSTSSASATARFAARSCTICATVLARPQRSRKRSDLHRPETAAPCRGRRFFLLHSFCW